jgi:ATP-dependent DNA helicase DinG
MRLYLSRDLPDPNETERFIPAAAQAIIRFVRKSHGQAFVLFTSASMLRQMAALVRAPLGDEGYTLLVQGEGMDRHAMLNTFRRGKNSVLFGLDSFWMGVDVRGDALRNVIIVKLPFAVPDHPVVKARMDRLREQGRQPFRDYSLPEAVLKFRQGVGRLIRTATDEGVIVVLDSRLVQKPYGRFFLRSMPACRVTHFWQDGAEEDVDIVEE